MRVDENLTLSCGEAADVFLLVHWYDTQNPCFSFVCVLLFFFQLPGVVEQRFVLYSTQAHESK